MDEIAGRSNPADTPPDIPTFFGGSLDCFHGGVVAAEPVGAIAKLERFLEVWLYSSQPLGIARDSSLSILEIFDQPSANSSLRLQLILSGGLGIRHAVTFR